LTRHNVPTTSKEEQLSDKEPDYWDKQREKVRIRRVAAEEALHRQIIEIGQQQEMLKLLGIIPR
jgi:hypothetical protein